MMNFHRRTIFLLALSSALLCLAESSLEPLPRRGQLAEERKFVRQAEEAIREEDFVDAADYYTKAGKLSHLAPEQAAQYHYQAAQMLLKAKRTSRASKAYTRLLEKYLFYVPTNDVCAQLRLLAQYFRTGTGTFLGLTDLTAAIKVYQLILRCQPSIEQSLDDRLMLARLQIDSHEDQAAVITYQETVKLAPNSPDVRFGLAMLLQRLAREGDGDGQRTRAAMREARVFLQLAPPSDPRRPQAEAILVAGREAEAERLIERAEFYLIRYHYRPEVSRRYLHDILREYADTKAAEKARHLLATKFPKDNAPSGK